MAERVHDGALEHPTDWVRTVIIQLALKQTLAVIWRSDPTNGILYW